MIHALIRHSAPHDARVTAHTHAPAYPACAARHDDDDIRVHGVANDRREHPWGVKTITDAHRMAGECTPTTHADAE